MRDAVIVGAVRTPIGRRKGALAGVHPVDLSAHVLQALVERTGLDPADVTVQAVVGHVDDADELTATETVAMAHVGAADGVDRFEAVVPLPAAGLTGYTYLDDSPQA